MLIMISNRKQLSVQDLALCAMMAAVIAVCSWVTVRIGEVPFTLQTFGVALSLCMLGGGRGFVSVFVYILLGIVGLPVFSGFQGGAGVLFGMTGGYIVGFLLMALTYMAATRVFGDKLPAVIAGLVVGLILCYAFGTAWFMIAYTREKGAISLSAALSACVTPFIIPDAVKLSIAVFLSRRVKKILNI